LSRRTVSFLVSFWPSFFWGVWWVFFFFVWGCWGVVIPDSFIQFLGNPLCCFLFPPSFSSPTRWQRARVKYDGFLQKLTRVYCFPLPLSVGLFRRPLLGILLSVTDRVFFPHACVLMSVRPETESVAGRGSVATPKCFSFCAAPRVSSWTSPTRILFPSFLLL